MLLILPADTVTLSCTGPYCVETASLVTVFVEPVDAFVVAAELLDDDELDEDDVPVDGVDVPVDAVAGELAESWAWKPSVAASPVTVAARTIGARFMP